MIEPVNFNSNQTFIGKMKKCFNVGNLKLRTLIKDVFEKSDKKVEKQVHNMDVKNNNTIYPNSVSAPDEVFISGGGSEIQFFSEDLKKMESMDIDEMLAYKEKLINEKRYNIN